jgi:hypothetical protein
MKECEVNIAHGELEERRKPKKVFMAKLKDLHDLV